jgi:predicted metalloprotease with PDZ domain
MINNCAFNDARIYKSWKNHDFLTTLVLISHEYIHDKCMINNCAFNDARIYKSWKNHDFLTTLVLISHEYIHDKCIEMHDK